MTADPVEPAAVAAALQRDGYAHLRGLDRAAYRALGAALGELLREDSVELREGSRAYVETPAVVPLHTDHPEVELISWWCEEQDASDGASLLRDSRPLVALLTDSERAALQRTFLLCPPLAGGAPSEPRPVLWSGPRGASFFYSPWLAVATEPPPALALLRQQLASDDGLIDLRLQPGEALFVDNQRVLHGRRPLEVGSRRTLRRMWLRETRSSANPNAAPAST